MKNTQCKQKILIYGFKNLYKIKKFEKCLINKTLQINPSKIINIYIFANRQYIYKINIILKNSREKNSS